MELQHLCFEFVEELRPGVIFQRNYSPRATDTPEISVLPCPFSSQLTKIKTVRKLLWPLLVVNLSIPGLS